MSKFFVFEPRTFADAYEGLTVDGDLIAVANPAEAARVYVQKRTGSYYIAPPAEVMTRSVCVVDADFTVLQFDFEISVRVDISIKQTTGSAKS